MNLILACVPSARLCTPISKSFAQFGIHAEASPVKRNWTGVVEHLPCPIEPAEKSNIWIAIHDGLSIPDFLEATFLNVDFIMSVMPKAKTEDDLLTLECLVAAGSARTIAQAFLKQAAPGKLYKAARAEGSKAHRRHLAETILGVPNLAALLIEYADSLVAKPRSLTFAA